MADDYQSLIQSLPPKAGDSDYHSLVSSLPSAAAQAPATAPLTQSPTENNHVSDKELDSWKAPIEDFGKGIGKDVVGIYSDLYHHPGDFITGYGEAVGSMLEGFPKLAFEGLSGVFASALHGDTPDAFSRGTEWARHAAKIVPDLPLNKTAKRLMEVWTAPFGATHAAGESVFNATGSPALATATEAIPDALMSLVPTVKGIKAGRAEAAASETGPEARKAATQSERGWLENRSADVVAKDMQKASYEKTSPAKPISTTDELADYLQKVSSNHTKDILQGRRILKDAGKSLTQTEAEELTHHVEKPGSSAASPETLDYNARVLEPIRRGVEAVAEQLNIEGFSSSEDVNYVHRIVADRGESMDDLAKGEEPKQNLMGGFYGRVPDSAKHRRYMALEDEAGNRRVVHVKDRVTGFDSDKNREDLGAAKQKTHQDLMDRELDPLKTEYNRISREGRTLARYQGVVSKASRMLSDVANRIKDIDDQRDVARHMDRLDAQIADLQKQHAALEPFSGDTRLSQRIGSLSEQIKNLSEIRDAMKEARDNAENPVALDAFKAAQRGAQERLGPARGERAALRRVQEPNRIQRAMDRIEKRIHDLRVQRAGAGMMKGDPQAAAAELAELETQRKVLAKAAETYNPGRRRLLNITKRAAELEKQMADVREKYAGKDPKGKVFIDKNKKQWRMRQATVKEIEAQTNEKYHKNYAVNLVKNWIDLKRKQRMTEALEHIIQSPLAKDRMMEAGSGPRPKGWVSPTKAQAFSKYWMDPRIAEVLDDVMGERGATAEAIAKVAKLLIAPIFFNPIPHVLNVGVHAVIEEGFFGSLHNLYPPEGVRYIRSWWNAMKDFSSQSPEYLDVMRHGGNLMYAKLISKEFSNIIGNAMRKPMENEPVIQQIARATGRTGKQLVDASYGNIQKFLWAANDVFIMRAVREHMSHGMNLQDAIRHTETHIPNYRVPSRIIMDNQFGRIMALTMKQPWTAFGRYHYGVFRSYAHMVRDITSRNASITDRARAADQLLMLGMVTFVVYPLLDKAVKKALHNPNASIVRSGASKVPSMIQESAQGKRDPSTIPPAVVTPNPGINFAIELLTNTDTFTGKKILNHDSLATDLHDLMHFALNQIAPLQWSMQVSEGKKTAKQEALAQIGIKDPSDEDIERQEKYQRQRERMAGKREHKRELQ